MDNKKIRQTTLNRNPIIWAKDAWFLAKPYWNSSEKYKAIALITTVIRFNLLMVATSVVFNKWNNVFYDTLQDFNKIKFYQQIIKFGYIVVFFITCAVLAYYFRKILEIRWRRWLTSYYLDKWFTSKAYYKTKFLSEVSDNPDQRISEDINSFIVLFMDV